MKKLLFLSLFTLSSVFANQTVNIDVLTTDFDISHAHDNIKCNISVQGYMEEVSDDGTSGTIFSTEKSKEISLTSIDDENFKHEVEVDSIIVQLKVNNHDGEIIVKYRATKDGMTPIIGKLGAFEARSHKTIEDTPVSYFVSDEVSERKAMRLKNRMENKTYKSQSGRFTIQCGEVSTYYSDIELSDSASNSKNLYKVEVIGSGSTREANSGWGITK